MYSTKRLLEVYERFMEVYRRRLHYSSGRGESVRINEVACPDFEGLIIPYCSLVSRSLILVVFADLSQTVKFTPTKKFILY